MKLLNTPNKLPLISSSSPLWDGESTDRDRHLEKPAPDHQLKDGQLMPWLLSGQLAGE